MLGRGALNRAVASGICLCGTAMTFDEAKTVAATPIDQVTQANVESVVDACVAITNFNKIAATAATRA